MAENYQAARDFEHLGDENGAPLYDPVEAAVFPQHTLRYRNQRWAERVGLDGLSDEEWIGHFSKFAPLPDNLKTPLALRYHGHQFRTYNPDIGDGRGFLFAQLRDDQGRLLDLGTKGSGQTPYSRFGDGRLTLKGGVREVLATEMLEALGVYTSKTFSLIETGEELQRQDEPSPTRSSVLVRLSHSHVRFGAFQRLAYEKNEQAIGDLIDYCVAHFYPELAGLEGEEKAIAFYKSVIQRTARLVAQWMAAGFVHGVLNTDNMNVTGESFDYGPWRFAPTADPGFTAAYFDQTGLYAFGRQGEACAWNLAQLGGALAHHANVDALNEALQTFSDHYETAMADAYFYRLGLEGTGPEDFAFVVDFLKWMTETGAPYEQVFFDWFCGGASTDRASQSPAGELYEQEKFADLKARLMSLSPAKPERLEHQYFQGRKPCTMLIDEVEAIWALIAENDDWSRFEEKLKAIAQMRDAYGFPSSKY
ncbi:YdiU family protein [Hyphococcus flavus]|uniref:Protein nucleotidyltransferase YdiU n=1 Tax=Hyphococcus flavus TaxID=1866326 RepID=A0AAF0CFV3_9PROT|nr:YdiU family protein [Hyphococcus flavus]WDI32831.1 YdiU family protein [Hyphococcus flavus]